MLHGHPYLIIYQDVHFVICKGCNISYAIALLCTRTRISSIIKTFCVCKGCNNSHAIVSLSHATSCSRRKKVPQEVFKTSSLSGCRWRNSRLCLENAPKGEIQTRQLARRLNRRRWAKTCGGKTAVTGFSLKTSKFLKMLILFFLLTIA